MAELSHKKRQMIWQAYCKRNEPMPGPELKGMGAARGNRVLKAKDQADKIKFPQKKWWECAEWQEYCPPKSLFSTLHLSLGQVIERAFARNILRHRKRKKRK